jgi:hypothetical protein
MIGRGTSWHPGRTAAVFAVAAAFCALPVLGADAGHGVRDARQTVERSGLDAGEKLALLDGMERAVAAGVPADDAAIIAVRSAERGESAAAVWCLDAVARLKQQGLPVRLALDRIEQGLAKGVPGERIKSMVERLSGHMAEARPMAEDLAGRGVLAAGQKDSATEAIARAYEKSVPAEAVAAAGDLVRKQKGSADLFNRSVDTMTTFAGSGMPAAEASRLVQRGLERGYSERDLSAMERYMAEELRKNRPIRDIVSGMEARMERGGMRGGVERHGGGTMRDAGPGRTGSGPGMGGRR